VLALAIALVPGCGSDDAGGPAQRGRQIYLSQCASCHAADPAQTGPVGPPVKGSSRVLLEAKVLNGTYPDGYSPKRPTRVMPPQPQLSGDIDALAAFLR
jgi:mono/diheme cytochrome c family protein